MNYLPEEEVQRWTKGTKLMQQTCAISFYSIKTHPTSSQFDPVFHKNTWAVSIQLLDEVVCYRAQAESFSLVVDCLFCQQNMKHSF